MALFKKNIEAEEPVIDWNPTQKVGVFFELDEENEKFAVLKQQGLVSIKYVVDTVCDYDDLLSYELLEDDNQVISGGIGRAVAGGIAFGGVGAIVGGSTGKRKSKREVSSLRVKIVLKDVSTPPIFINLISGAKFKTDSFVYTALYEQAQNIITVLEQIIASREDAQPTEQTQASAADEILKYKNLLDMGAITQEEFDSKKRELLGL